ncbi:helix-turn-helix transcriptional regulator [Gymnodinialimonas sp.]
MDNPERLLRRREVEGLIGLKRSKLYQMIREGLFPAPVKLTERAVAWRASDVSAWINSREVA